MNISKILIADNDILFLDLLEDILSEEGIEVHKARDGKEALEKLIENPPDVLITDLIMPKVSGEQLIEYVGKDIYVVALSGAVQEYQDIGNLKVDYYLHKADIESIRKGILKILEKIRESQKRPSDPEEIPVDHYLPRTIVKELVADRTRREQIFQCLKEGLIIYDVDRRVLWANQAACEIFNKSKNELLHSRLEDHFDTIVLDQVRQTAEEVGKESLGEAILRLSFGSKRLSLHFSNLVEYGSPGNFEGILLLQDITQQCLAEESLAHERDYYSGIMDSLDEGVIVVDRTFTVLYTNHFFEQLLNREASDIIGIKCHSLLFEESQPCPDCKILDESIFDLGSDFNADIKIKDFQGEPHIFKTEGGPLEIIDGTINSVLLTFNDITELTVLKKYVKATAEIAALLQGKEVIHERIKKVLGKVGETASATRGYWFLNLKANTGKLSSELKARWCDQSVGERADDSKIKNFVWEEVSQNLYQKLSKGEIISLLPSQLSGNAWDIFDTPGLESFLMIPLIVDSIFEGFIGFENCFSNKPLNEDQTNLLQSVADSLSKAVKHEEDLERLQSNDAKYNEIYNNINDIWFMHDMEGKILEMNPAVKSVLGYESDEVISSKIRDVIYDQYKDGFDEYLTDLKERGAVEGLMRVRNKNGDECILEYRNWLVELPDGTSVCRGVVRNVTEKIILESQLIQAQKMESIGTLAAGISHNFRNLLTGILTNSQIIQLKYKEDQELLRYTERINELSKMGADLITDLMQFSRKASLESKALINLGDVLNETLNIISKSFAEDITINSEWADFMPVYGDRSTLSQVFLNICTNARDAMPEGGSIFFEAKIKGEKVIVTITDTGCGIDKSIINFIFDPFFTTKEHGYGTGLGLSTAYGIVKAHKGEIKVKSKANKGTSFIISLPLASKKGKGEKKPDFTVSSGVNEKVLIVDKNKMVLETMNESITNLGYKAATAENIKDAIELCASWEPDILMLCDKIDDIEDLMESEKIFSVISKIKIIIVTEEENKKLTDIKSKIREYVAAFLLKPFDLAGLGKVLAETVKKK